MSSLFIESTIDKMHHYSGSWDGLVGSATDLTTNHIPFSLDSNTGVRRLVSYKHMAS